MNTAFVLARLVNLSPHAAVFFYFTSLLHIALKVLLGLSLVLDDGYGFHSLLAPPQVLIFAGIDVVVCFVAAKALDLLVPARYQWKLQTLLLVPLVLFLCMSFILHAYFKTFLTRGLLAFNGAGLHELSDYALSGLNRRSLSFIAVALLSTLLFVRFRPKLLTLGAPPWGFVPLLCAVLSMRAVHYVEDLSAGQSGWLAGNPLLVLSRSYLTKRQRRHVRATAREALAFKDPKPLHGRYDSVLDVQVPSQRGKNVLFVLVESLPLAQTPMGGAKGGLTVLDELANDGVSFTNFRTVFPATSRSFLTYHCGIYPTTGDATVTKYAPNYRCDSWVDLLKAHGYRTGFFTAPMFTYDNLHQSAVLKSYDHYEDGLSLRKQARMNAFDAPAVEEEAVISALLKMVKADRSTPFFATYFMFWNHAPYRLPFEDISHLPPRTRYKRTLSYLDRVLRDLLLELASADILKDTVVVIAADHGEGFGIHHRNFNHVGHVYEDDVNIPLLIHVHGLGRHTTARSGSNLDFAPTLTGLLGLPALPSWQGQDLLSEQYEPRPTLLFGRGAVATNAIVDGHYKYIEYLDSKKRYLFDLERDPHEQRNLVQLQPGFARDYEKLVRRWLPVVDYRAWAVSTP